MLIMCWRWSSLLLPVLGVRESLGFDSDVTIDSIDYPPNNDMIITNDNDRFEPQHSKTEYVVYWGQNSYGASHPASKELWEKELGEYCNDDTIDIFVVSFLNIFNAGTDKPPELNLSCHCNTTFEAHPQLLHCPNIGRDIIKCQQRGKKVLLSLGGAAGSYGFKNVAEANQFSKTIWNMFLGGTSKFRPFGDAKLDGVDLDIEGGSAVGYPELIHSLRELYVTSKERRYIIAGAPQCVFPDAFIGTALNQAWFDYVFIQFYNNYCGIQAFHNPNGFNYKDWESWAKSNSLNPRVKLFLGVPGSPTAASNGYLEPKTLIPILKHVSQSSHFGGIMTWDASQAGNNLLPTTELSFSSFMANWVHNPNFQFNLPHSFSTSTSSSSLSRVHDVISTQRDQSKALEGTSCTGNSWSCQGYSFNMCIAGIWIRFECPINFICSNSIQKVCEPSSPPPITTTTTQLFSLSSPSSSSDFGPYRLTILPIRRINARQTKLQLTLTSLTQLPLTHWKLSAPPNYRLSRPSPPTSSPTTSILQATGTTLRSPPSSPPRMSLTFTVLIESTLPRRRTTHPSHPHTMNQTHHPHPMNQTHPHHPTNQTPLRLIPRLQDWQLSILTH